MRRPPPPDPDRPSPAAAALTSLGHATPAAGAGQTGQWFREVPPFRVQLSDLVFFYFLFFLFSFPLLFCSYLLHYLTTCYFVSCLVTLTES